MKKVLLSLLLLVLCQQYILAQVAINSSGANPVSSAMLDVSSTNKGMLMPRMTSAQRKAIATPETGLFVYDLDKQTPYMFDGYKWRPLSFTTEGNLPLVERDVPGGNGNGKFGYTVAIHGNTAAAYSYQDTAGGFSSAGSVSIFSKESGTWEFVTRLTAPNPQVHGRFGEALAIENDVLVVGQAYYDKPGKADVGNVYIYKKTGNTWTLTQQLSGSQEMADAGFGCSLAINNGRIAIGARGQTVGSTVAAGAVYIFKQNGNNYTEEKYLPYQATTPSGFGASVSLHNSNLLIGAPSAKQGVVKCGLAFLYTLVANTQQWTYTSTWGPSVTHENLYFGSSVSLLNDIAVVGAYGYTSSGNHYGRIERFKKSGNNWVYGGFNVGFANSYFGYNVAVFESGYLVSSHYEKDGRVRLFDLKDAQQKIYKDNLATEGVTGWQFGHSIAIHNGHFIIGMPNKNAADAGVVQFGVIE